MPDLRCALTALLILTLLPHAAAQARPQVVRSPAAALQAFRKVADRPEPARQAKITALGRFAGPEVDALLFAELERAKTLGYKQAVVRAIGTKRRAGALERLVALLDDPGAGSSMLYSVAYAIGGQGEAAIPVLRKLLADPPADARTRGSRASSLFGGLRRVGTAAAYAAIIDAGRNGSPSDLQYALQNLRNAPASPELTAFRLECLEAQNVSVRYQALTQLADAGYPKIREAALELYEESTTGRGTPGTYTAQLAEVFVKILGPETYEPFLVTAATAYQRLDEIVKPLRGKVDGFPGLVDWLLDKGLRRKVPTERVVAMRLLALSKDPRVGELLVKQVASRDPGISLMAIRALGERGDESAVPMLRRALKGRGEARQIAALETLHLLLKDEPEWRQDLVTIFRGRDVKLKVLAMDLLAGMQAADLLPEVYRLLDHKSWLVRAAAYDYCRVVRSLDSVSPLIARIDAERGRLREDCLDALKAITSYRMFDSDRWRSWWKENKATFKMPTLAQALPKKRSRPAASTVSSFFDIPLVSNRVTFVIDASGSMSAGMSTVSSSGAQSNTRIEEAKRQLARVVGELPKDAVFNVIYFESGVEAFAKAARRASRRHKAAALGFVKRLAARGGTNIHDALELAFTDDQVDTIYLLSDGAPSAGKITDPEKLADEVARWNKVRRIRIHTIAIGSKSTLMERLAKESGGAYVNVR